MILVDGKPATGIPVEDRGLAYGDGVFETLRTLHGKVPLLPEHLTRLAAGLAALGIPVPARRMMEQEIRDVAQSCPDGIIKLIVTRGSGGRGYQWPAPAAARRILQTFPLPPDRTRWQRDGMAVIFCRTPLEGPVALAGIKHLNRLPQVLARGEWNDSGIHEGLMRDREGRIVEGTRSNLFVYLGQTLVTPPVGAGVDGIMRRLVLDLAQQRELRIQERHLSDSELHDAEELFLANSILGVCPVRRLADRVCDIGTITRLLQSAVENELERRAR